MDFVRFIYQRKYTIIIFVLLSIIFTFPLFLETNRIGIVNWDLWLFYHEAARVNILEYKQMPFWSPFSCGGNVLLAHPESQFFSPMTLLNLLLGTILGIKISILIHFLFGLISMYILARYFRLSKTASYASAFLYMLSSTFSMRIGVGQFDYLAMAFYPLAFLFFLKSVKELRYAIFSSLFLALSFFYGAVYEVFFLILFLGIYTLIISIIKEDIRPFKALFFICMLFFLLSSIKMIPVLEFISNNPRLALYSSDEYTGLSDFLDNIVKTVRLSRYYIGGGTPDDPIWWEGSIGIGFIGLLFVIIGLISVFKRGRPLFVTTIVFILISLGSTLPISLWGIIHFFPPFEYFHVIGRVNIILLFCFSILAGYGFSELEHRLNKNNYLARSIIIIILLASLVIMNGPIINDALRLTLPAPEGGEFFHQTIKDYNFGYSSTMFLALRENKGDLSCTVEEIRPATSVSAIPKENPLYKGEAYLLGNGTLEIIYFSPNKVILKTNTEEENRVIINQNYEKNWKVSNGRVENFKGLLSAKTSSGENILTFYYFPASFVIGLIITIISLLLWFIFVRKKNKLTMTLFMILLVIFIFFYVYNSIEQVDIPNIYNEIKNDPDDYKIIEIPFTSPLFNALRYYSGQHGKEVVWHHPSQKIDYKTHLLKKISLSDDIADYEALGDILIQDINKISLSVINYYNIKKVILHKKWYGSEVDWRIFSNPLHIYNYSKYYSWYGNEYYNQTKKLLDKRLIKYYEDDEVIGYDVPDTKNKMPFMLMDKGWSWLEFDESGGTFVWMKDKASIKIISFEEMDIRLKIKVKMTYNEAKTLGIFNNKELIGRYVINNGDEIISNLNIKKGENEIILKSREGCYIPSRISESKDKRCLSFALSDIEIIE